VGKIENIDAPEIAKNYYGLSKDSKLRDVVLAVREDERGHAQENHRMADVIKDSK
jgi:ubiquinol oxidase